MSTELELVVRSERLKVEVGQVVRQVPDSFRAVQGWAACLERVTSV